jgi:ankyrin repeat protein
MSNLSNTYTDDNNTDYSKLILKAFSDRKPEIAAFIVEQTKQKISFDKLDRYGRNIIHYLVIFYGFESLRNLLNSIIQNSSERKLKTVLNLQDNLGNTPLHYAIMFNLNELATILINKGANPKLKNKDGNSIVTDKECDDNDNVNDDNYNNDDNSAKPKMKSLVILMKASPKDLSSIGNINSISNLDELSMSNASNNMSSDVFIRKNRDLL